MSMSPELNSEVKSQSEGALIANVFFVAGATGGVRVFLPRRGPAATKKNRSTSDESDDEPLVIRLSMLQYLL